MSLQGLDQLDVKIKPRGMFAKCDMEMRELTRKRYAPTLGIEQVEGTEFTEKHLHCGKYCERTVGPTIGRLVLNYSTGISGVPGCLCSHANVQGLEALFQ